MLSSSFLSPYYKAGDAFPNLLARSTYLGKYKRLEDANWTDTNLRVVRGNCALDPNLSQAEEEYLFNAQWQGWLSPPGRGWWTGGVQGIPVDARYNCWYCTLRGVDDWCFVADMLMCGGGVGVGLQHIHQLPAVQRNTAHFYVLCSKSHPNAGEVLPNDFIAGPGDCQFVLVDDSRQGWVEALRATLKAAFEGKSLVVNVSSIRKRGAPIKTFGGVACGPAPLANLLRAVWSIVRGAQGRRLSSVEALDITNHIGVCIKSGNVRRSALIVLGNADDQAFRDAKKDWQAVQAHRHSSNNSIVFETEEQIDRFDWNALVEDNATYGEPGILNLWKIRQTDPGVEGVNPCFRANTRIHTKQGHYEIKDLVGRTVEVWDGEMWRAVETFQKTSENEPMLKFTLQDGSSFSVTKYHIIVTEDGQRIEAKDVKVGAKLSISNAPLSHGKSTERGAYAKGFLIGDGSIGAAKDQAMLWLYATKYGCAERLARSIAEIPAEEGRRSDCIADVKVASTTGERSYMQGITARSTELKPWVLENKKRLPKRVFLWNYETKLDFVAGYLDADGTASKTTNGFMYQVCSVEKEFLLDFQELLKTIGVRSKIALMRGAGKKDFNDGYGEYETRDCWRLTISQAASVALAKQVKFERLKSFAEEKVSYKVKPKFNEVVSIQEDGVDEEVYCLVTDDPDQIACSNGLIIGRCGEIPLYDREACCLSEVYPALCPPGELEKVFRAAARYTVRQRLESMSDRRADSIRRLNMRIGVGLGGICDFTWTNDHLTYWRSIVQDEARRYAAELDVVEPIATTTVKPSGTISLLNGSSPGIHAPFAPFYIRRTRIATNEPMAEALKEAGVPHESCVYDSTGQTLVFSFPMSSSAEMTVQNQTVGDQIRRQVAVQQAWADNAVSSTISFNADEKGYLAACLEKYAKELKSISCLPRQHGYAQPPYEEIDKETFIRMSNRIDAGHPLTVGGELDTLECEGGVCPVK